MGFGGFRGSGFVFLGFLAVWVFGGLGTLGVWGLRFRVRCWLRTFAPLGFAGHIVGQ